MGNEVVLEDLIRRNRHQGHLLHKRVPSYPNKAHILGLSNGILHSQRGNNG